MIIDPDQIANDIKIIATNHNSKYPCILGRDLINETPKLKTHLDNMKEAVNKMTQEVKSYFAKINRENNPNYIFKIHLSDQSQENLSINSLFDIDISDEEELNLLRQKAQEELKKYAANSLTDLEPSKHSEVSFKIELTDPNMKPIRCKMRPIAHNLKDKVKQALAEQEAAGIIRKSFSAWSAPLKIVINRYNN